MTALDIGWLSGVLEGDGWFGSYQPDRVRHSTRPVVRLTMADRDVVERFARLVGVSCSGPFSVRKDNHRPMHSAAVSGSRAVGVMMTVYSLMGERRKARIKELITQWRNK